ncbi:MAG: TPM domain-containing protein [Erysipelotrichaceae bacterium]|jgi:uncharacterized membrane protein YgcG|nr:TPM domain-containing protein [Erysipelotrichaceae bacterium]
MRKLKNLFLLFIISLFFLVPINASSTDYVKDDYGLLSASEIEELNTQAKKISQTYNVGVYVRVKADYEGSSIEKYAETVYADEQLGLGTAENRECVMLIITMADRSYDILAHGTEANTAFTDYGKEKLGKGIISYLKEDDYQGGFQYFIEQCSTYLETSKQGAPIDVNTSDAEEDRAIMQNVRYGITFIGAPLLALIICMIIKAKNKTAGIASEASDYVPKNGLQVTGMQDIFLYRTETVTHIDHDHDAGGGTTINSGGFSHSSGHF